MKLKRELSFFDLTNIVIGSIIGSDIYIASAITAGLIGPFSVVVWVLAGLAAVIALSWVWLLMGAGLHMDEMDMGGGQIMLMAPDWSAGYAVVIFLMWAIMMMAMMLPSAAPAILLTAALLSLGSEIGKPDTAVLAAHRNDKTSVNLATIPGMAPLIASAPA